MNRFIKLVMALQALVLATAFPAAAENLILEEITVRGQKESPREESLSIREVRESVAKDVGEAMKQMEGLSYVRKGAIGNDIVLRGFQKDNINVFVDGARLHGACPSRMDPPSFHYDFAEVEQIKVIKGPYDSENPGSLGGMVDVRTRVPQPGFSGELNGTYGSFNSTNVSAVAAYGAERYDGLLGYAYKRSDVPESGNGKLITDVYPATSPNRYRAGDVDSRAYEINSVWGKFGFKPTAASRTELSYSYQDAEHVLYPYLKMDADYDRTNRVNWSYRIGEISPRLQDVLLQVYWNDVSHLMNDRLRMSSATSVRPYSMQTDASTQTVGVKLNGTLNLGAGALKTGIDYYNRNWEAVNQRAGYTTAQPYTLLNMVPDVFVDNLGLFGAYEMPLNGRLSLKGALRGDFSWIEPNKGNPLVAKGDGKELQAVSGNLQLSYTPAAGIELFTGLGRGVRIPDAEELYLIVPAAAPAVTWRGNPGLRPTVNHQADIGTKFSSDRFYVNASLFYSDLQDYVNFYSQSATVKSYQNIHASMWGGELGTQISLPHDFFLRGGLSYTEGKNRTADRPLAEIPPLRGLVAARYDNGVWFAEIVENLANRQNRVDSGLNEQTTAGWETTDLKAGYTAKNLSVFAGVDNLFDRQYYSHLSYLRDPFSSGVGVKVPETGRNLYLTVSLKF